jgi:hypothetical protein
LAATIFEIIGVVAIVVAVLVAVLVLPFLSRALKRFNKSGVERAHQVRTQVTSSLGGVEDAQVQIDSVAAVTEGVKAGMTAAIATADQAVTFLESRAFQVGLPAVLWFLLLVVALPRGLHRARPKKIPRRVIPPPSWEATEAGSE